MELNIKDVTYNDFILNLSLNNNELIGLTGQNNLEILEFLQQLPDFKGQIYFNNEKITKDNKLNYKSRVTLIKKEYNFPVFTETVKDYLLYIIRQKRIITKDDYNKAENALRIVGLSKEYQEKRIIELSSSEKKLIQIASSLLSNPSIIFLDEPFLNFDLKHQKQIMMLLERLQEQYKKIIVISSSNSNYLYKYTKRLILIKNKQILIDGKTKDIYERVDYLKKNKFNVPTIVEFIYKIKKNKNIRLEYHKDIRDLIKDIYKHV